MASYQSVDLYDDSVSVCLLGVFVGNMDVIRSSKGSKVYNVVKVHPESHYVVNVLCFRLENSYNA